MAHQRINSHHHGKEKMGEDEIMQIKKEVSALLSHPGILVYRVNSLRLEEVKEEDIGTFYTGDCYVVVTKRKGGNVFIHYWIGSESSQDEQAFAAIMTVTLDDHLGGKAIQCREIEGHESSFFLPWFRTGVVYRKGGHKTGFKNVNDRIAGEGVRLYRVKGKSRPKCVEVDRKTSSLHSDDCFILDTSRKYDKVFLLVGKRSNLHEQRKGNECVQRFQSKNVVRVDEKDLNTHELTSIMKKALDVSIAKELKFDGISRDSDDDFEEEFKCKVELHRVHDNEITEKPVLRSSLLSGDCYVLKTPQTVYIWKGRGASSEEKNGALELAEKFIKDMGMPAKTKIVTEPENLETIDFQACFEDWDEVTKKDFSRPSGSSNIAKSVQTKIDFKSLYNSKPTKERTDPNLEDDSSDGNGYTQVFEVIATKDSTGRCKFDEKMSHDESAILKDHENFGIFNSGDSYVIVYTYKNKAGRNKTIIYYWLGNDSGTFEQGAASVYASKLDDSKFAGQAMQIRVPEGREPPLFMKIFGGSIIVKQPTLEKNSTRLFRVKGKEGNIRIVEDDVSASNLDANDCFLLKTGSKVGYIWHGSGSLGDEQRVAHERARSLFGKSTEIMKIGQGKEPNDFWSAIGGKRSYQDKVFVEDNRTTAKGPRAPRLFQLYNRQGTIGSLAGEEIIDFIQDDLVSDDVFILDIFNTVFLWYGKDCRKDELQSAEMYFKEYIEKGAENRTIKDVDLFKVREGAEPLVFKQYFPVWEDRPDQKVPQEAEKASWEASWEPTKVTYSYNELCSCASDLPIDKTKKEAYLSREQFRKVFDMEKKDFYALAKWKQNELKKKVSLY